MSVAGDPKSIMAPLLERGLMRARCEVLANIWLPVDSLDSGTHLVLVSPVLECIIEINMLHSWNNPYTGSLVCRIRGTMVDKNKYIPGQDSKSKEITHPWRHGREIVTPLNKDLDDAGVVVIISLFNTPIWLLQKPDGS